MTQVPTTTPEKFAVLGAGTWGITLANILTENGHQVCCWDIDQSLINHLNTHRRHPRLGDFQLSPDMRLTTDLYAALNHGRHIVLVVPSKAMRPVCESIKASGKADAVEDWIICSKGIEQQTLMLMNEVLIDVLGESAEVKASVLSGPSHAEEVSRGLPTTLVAANRCDPERARNIQGWFFRNYLRIYTHDDIQGVELGASVKNVIAIAGGISDGMGFGDNTRAALMTRGLAEMVRLGIAAGARLETFMGLSGIGDLIVTAGSRHSRNHQFGTLLAKGLTCEKALEEVGMVVEGYTTALSAWQLGKKYKVELPISEAVYQVCYEGKSAQQAVKDLLARDPKPEHY